MNLKVEQSLRLYTGLIIAFFLVLHLLNAGLGIVGLSVMDTVGQALFVFWSIPLFSVLLYGSFIIHIGLIYVGLYRRRSFRMPGWNLLQYALALLLPVLLVGHILGTRGAFQFLDTTTSYSKVVTGLWKNPERVIKQLLLVSVAWTHMAIGLHYWLRHKEGYGRWVPVLYPLCLIIPLFAAAGFISAGFESQQITAESQTLNSTSQDLQQVANNPRELLAQIETIIFWTLSLLLLATFVFRSARAGIEKRRGGFVISHTSSNRLISGRKNQTVLDALRDAGVAHASVCGGRGRCTTCRIRLADCQNPLPEPEALESRALKRMGASPDLRLACQLKPNQNVTITPLLPASTTYLDAGKTAGVVGQEKQVTCMFVDMRDSTTLGESKLPYDVVFILNQFFIQLDEALRETNGHYATFNGDGLMALYGLNTDMASGCRDALRGAMEIQQRISRLNEWLREELGTPLRVGIGIHCGDAIVGTMGPPDARTVSAVGDNVNVAARLETLSKEFATGLVVSEDVLNNAGVDYASLPGHTVELRGREEPLNIVVVDDPGLLLDPGLSPDPELLPDPGLLPDR